MRPDVHPGSEKDGRSAGFLDRELAQVRSQVVQLRDDVLADSERHEREATDLRARIAEERRRADDAQDALAALRRRAGGAAAEVRLAEERLAAERQERERTVGELRTRLADAERDAEHERAARHRERFAADHSAQERVQAAMRETELVRERARAAAERTRGALDVRERELAIERATYEHERAAVEQRVASLRSDIEATIPSLRAELQQERVRMQTLTAGLHERDRTVTRLEAELQASRRRADTIRGELARRDAIVDRVTGVARDLRSGLEAVKTQVQAEHAERKKTDELEQAAGDAVSAAVRDPDPAAVVVDPAPVQRPVASPVRPTVGLRAGRPRSSGNLNDLLDRFDQIRTELAEQGVGSAPPDADR